MQTITDELRKRISTSQSTERTLPAKNLTPRIHKQKPSYQKWSSRADQKFEKITSHMNSDLKELQDQTMIGFEIKESLYSPRSPVSTHTNLESTIQDEIASAVKSVDNALKNFSQRETLRSLSNETRSASTLKQYPPEVA
jgi:hypothetical protein